MATSQSCGEASGMASRVQGSRIGRLRFPAEGRRAYLDLCLIFLLFLFSFLTLFFLHLALMLSPLKGPGSGGPGGSGGSKASNSLGSSLGLGLGLLLGLALLALALVGLHHAALLFLLLLVLRGVADHAGVDHLGAVGHHLLDEALLHELD